jgi:hypothetical protein
MEFSREHPNNYQREIFENLFELNRLKEEAQLNVALLKQRLVHKQLPRSFESLRLPTPIELESIRNKEIRRRLEEQAKKILERTQAEMMLVYMSATEVKLNELQKKFDQDMDIMKKNLSNFLTNEKLSDKMVDILYRRFTNLEKRLVCIYKIKLDFFVKAPTVMN